MLVDAGGAPANRFDVGGNVVAPWLSRRGLRRVDYLVLSTGRTDHCGGAESLLQDFAVGELWLPEAHELGRLGRLAALAKEKGARVRRMHAGMGLETGGATLRVLAPPREGGKRAESDACLVLSLRYGKNSLLLPSDITAGDEKRLLETQGPALSHRVLVLPRHGASTAGSEAFLDAVRPRLALLSVGPNSWRWPSDEALRRCEARGVRVLRSDREGMTSLRFFPEDWNMGWENGK
jgi:competence protein ComEC